MAQTLISSTLSGKVVYSDSAVAEHVHDIFAFHGEVMDDRPNAVMK
ncbi:hypothetical protein N9C22_03475 [Paracoccaceae bacterium]|nr:hypothetical protein [Paracoccaceae bacterium]